LDDHAQGLAFVESIPRDREADHHCALGLAPDRNFGFRRKRGERTLLERRKGLEIAIIIDRGCGNVAEFAGVGLERGLDVMDPQRLDRKSVV